MGELWHASTSDDGSFELFIRADIFDPVEVLGVLVHELIHAVLPIDAGHGKRYKDAALKLGLQGKMAHAMPGPLLRRRRSPRWPPRHHAGASPRRRNLAARDGRARARR